MRITRPTLNIFLTELEQLEKAAVKVREDAKNWSNEQKWRDEGYAPDQWQVQYLRGKLERSIVAYREQLAKIYDYSGDAGLR
jgi:hypothetical protein